MMQSTGGMLRPIWPGGVVGGGGGRGIHMEQIAGKTRDGITSSGKKAGGWKGRIPPNLSPGFVRFSCARGNQLKQESEL